MTSAMKAAVLGHEKINVEQRCIPQPKPGQTLVKVLACGVCGSDINLYKDAERIISFSKHCGHPDPMDLDKGVVMGHEFCGEIVEHGDSSSNALPVGTSIVARPQILMPNKMDYIGFSSAIAGGFAEYLLVDSNELLQVPNGLEPSIASMTEPLAVAEHAVNASNIAFTDVPLIAGAGPIGLSIVAILKNRGFSPIVVSEPDTQRRILAKKLGADVVIDPKEQSLTEEWVNVAIAKGRLNAESRPWLVYNCVGAVGFLSSLITTVPRQTRIIQLGMNIEQESLSTMLGCPKELTIQFVSGYSKSEFSTCLNYLSEGLIDISVLNSPAISLDELDAAILATMSSPSLQAGKIIVDPGL